jgi:hypothetical protein
MNHTGIRILIGLIAALLTVSCNKHITPSAPVAIPGEEDTFINPAKEILINNGRFEKPCTLLGQIEYTLKSNRSSTANRSELRSKAINALKNEALVKFGDKVDAIIDTKVQENLDEVDNSLTVTNIQGIAISFGTTDIKIQKPMPSLKPRHKKKHKKHGLHKVTSKKHYLPRRKKVPVAKNITPLEMLK